MLNFHQLKKMCMTCSVDHASRVLITRGEFILIEYSKIHPSPNPYYMWGCTIVDVMIVLFYLHPFYHSESSLSLSRNKPAPVYSSCMKTLKDYKVIMWSLCCMWSCDPCVYVIMWPLCTDISCSLSVRDYLWPNIGKQNQIPHQVKPK